MALLDQRVVAGLGNIYVAEAPHLAGLSPFRAAASIATPTGKPRPTAMRLTVAIKAVLKKAVARQTRQRYRSDRFRVFDVLLPRLPALTPPHSAPRKASRSAFSLAVSPMAKRVS